VCTSTETIIRAIKSRRIRYARHVARIGDIIKAERRYVGRHRRRLEDNIKMDLRETVWENVILFILLRRNSNVTL
jgi:hypothetical protein